MLKRLTADFPGHQLSAEPLHDITSGSGTQPVAWTPNMADGNTKTREDKRKLLGIKRSKEGDLRPAVKVSVTLTSLPLSYVQRSNVTGLIRAAVSRPLVAMPNLENFHLEVLRSELEASQFLARHTARLGHSFYFLKYVWHSFVI